MSEVIANTHTPPDWLSKDFLQDALRSSLRRSSLQLVDCKICPATNVGDNYLSEMYRASTVLNGKRDIDEKLSLIIKSLPKGETVEKFVNEMSFFTRETKMLVHTLPKLQSVLDEVGLPRLFARLYYHQGDPNNLLIMEDLCQDGFRPANRLEGLDLQQCILVLETLAEFHAASLVAMERHPDIKERHKKEFWHMSIAPYMEKFIVEGMDGIINFSENWKDQPANFVDSLKKYKTVAMKRMFAANNRRDEEFNVLTHGDTWTNNFMFKYENGKPVAVKLVDFQLSCYTSPVTDLLYFIFSSARDEIKVSQIDFFLRTYHDKLMDVCEKLRFRIDFTFQELHKTFIQRLDFAFLAALIIFPFTTAPSKDVVSLEDSLTEEKDGSAIYKSQKFEKGMKTMLPYFIENGMFNVNEDS